tara:strand:- start:385 stop:1038 length:654 start_codon:yes stop_codon:yes gene_type:complete
MIMTNTSVASSAIAVPVPMIHGKPAVELQDTIFTIGEETGAAEALMAKGKQALDVLDSNLNDIIKGLSYSEFMLVRDFHKAGNIDKGRSDDAAQKIWERQINRCVSTFDFVKPKSESKDAVRKAEAKVKEVERLAKYEEDDLHSLKDGLLRNGDNKSLNEVKKINAELTRRNASAIDAEKAELKALTDKINTRVKELAKSGTPDAVELLTQVAMILG